MSSTTVIAHPGSHEVVIERDFDAPPALLFRAWTDPDLLVQWLGPCNLTMKIDAWDARDRGQWRYVHTDPDGHEFGFHEVFHGTPSVDGAVVQTL